MADITEVAVMEAIQAATEADIIQDSEVVASADRHQTVKTTKTSSRQFDSKFSPQQLLPRHNPLVAVSGASEAQLLAHRLAHKALASDAKSSTPVSSSLTL